MDTRFELRERKLKQVKQLLLSGEKFTAIRINELVHTSDARKIISVLRQKGMPIVDKIIDERSGTKIYWLDREAYEKSRQLSLFDLDKSGR